jgi:thiamine-monophosphate kinase
VIGDDAHISDEPDRLANIVASMFSGQSGNGGLSARLANGAGVALLAGADAQDDCAVLRLSGEQELVVGSDYVRGAKFRLYEFGLLSDYDIGYYLVAANVSDIAAMGARPIGMLTVVRYPPTMTDTQFATVLRGIRDACAHFGAPNVGGDIGGSDSLVLSGTAFGVCLPGHALMRGGARPGDLLCATGPTGIAGAAMSYFRSRRTSASIEQEHRASLLASWTRPQARVREGEQLGSSGLATSCQDTSDGLKATVEAIAAASGVGVTVDEQLIQPTPEVAAVCAFLDIDPMSIVFGDSVDFELVFSLPKRNLDALTDVFAANGLAFSVIGQVTAARDVLLHRLDGTHVPLPGKAWRHAPEQVSVNRKPI